MLTFGLCVRRQPLAGPGVEMIENGRWPDVQKPEPEEVFECAHAITNTMEINSACGRNTECQHKAKRSISSGSDDHGDDAGSDYHALDGRRLANRPFTGGFEDET